MGHVSSETGEDDAENTEEKKRLQEIAKIVKSQVDGNFYYYSHIEAMAEAFGVQSWALLKAILPPRPAEGKQEQFAYDTSIKNRYKNDGLIYPDRNSPAYSLIEAAKSNAAEYYMLGCMSSADKQRLAELARLPQAEWPKDTLFTRFMKRIG